MQRVHEPTNEQPASQSSRSSSCLQVPEFARDRVLELLRASVDVSGSSVRVLMSSEEHCPDIEMLSDVIKVCLHLHVLDLPHAPVLQAPVLHK